MKSRDDFINSVWEKSEKAMAEERARKRKQRRLAGGLAAACLTLVIGITSAGGPAEVFEDLRGGASPDKTVFVEDIEMQDTDNAAPGAGEAAVITSSDGYGEADDIESYGSVRKEPEDAAKSIDSGTKAYYCLPLGIEIAGYAENYCDVVSISSEAGVTEYFKWFVSLPEDRVLTDEEFRNLKEIPSGYYKFTMDYSIGADTEGVDTVYWIVGEVSLP